MGVTVGFGVGFGVGLGVGDGVAVGAGVGAAVVSIEVSAVVTMVSVTDVSSTVAADVSAGKSVTDTDGTGSPASTGTTLQLAIMLQAIISAINDRRFRLTIKANPRIIFLLDNSIHDGGLFVDRIYYEFLCYYINEKNIIGV